MSRVKIEFPEKFFDKIYSIPVRIIDINYGNHLGNHSLVGIIQEARMLFLQQHNFTELEVNGTGLIMADLAVEFKNESFYGDIIQIKLAAVINSKVNFDFYYKIFVLKNDVEILIAKAKTGMVCYNYAIKKVASIPDELKRILEN